MDIRRKDSLEMLRYFPLLLPKNNFSSWEGIINIMGNEVFVQIDTPNYPCITNIRIKCPPGFQSIVNNVINNVENIEDRSLTEILLAFQKTNVLPTIRNVDNDASNKTVNDDASNKTVNDDDIHRNISCFTRYDEIFKELKTIGIHNIVKTGGSLTHISLKEVDDSGYEHILDMELPKNYPLKKPLLEYADLPDVVLPQLTASNTINEMFTNFCSVIAKLQKFWNVYDTLRKSAWVIDPEHPKKRDTYCRIALSENVSILVSLNPVEVMTFPDIKFLGAEKAIAPLRKALEDNLEKHGWDMNEDLIDNLLTILGLEEFPQPPSRTSSQHEPSSAVKHDVLVAEQECCICFMLRTHDNMLPTKICNNDKCPSVFHISCLAQWFQSVPTNEPSFNLISGDCPHCGKRILCPMTVI